MNILLAYYSPVFNYGKITNTAEHTKNNLKNSGAVFLLRIPLSLKNDSDWFQHVLALNLLKLDNTDLLITLNAPSCYLNHPKHIVWLQEKPHIIHPLLIGSSILWTSKKSIYNRLLSAGLTKALHKPIPRSPVEWNNIKKYIKSI